KWRARCRIGQNLGPPGRLASGRIHNAEISVQRGRRGKDRQGLRRRLAVASSLVSAEEEQLLFPDRPAKRTSELVTLQSVVRCREEISSVERSVAQELENIPVKLVRPRLGDCVYRRAGVQPVPRG